MLQPDINHLQWLSYTPSMVPATGSCTCTTSGKYLQFPSKVVLVNISMSVTNNGTASGAPSLTLPIASDIKFFSSTIFPAITGFVSSGYPVFNIAGLISNNAVAFTNYDGGMPFTSWAAPWSAYITAMYPVT